MGKVRQTATRNFSKACTIPVRPGFKHNAAHTVFLPMMQAHIFCQAPKLSKQSCSHIVMDSSYSAVAGRSQARPQAESTRRPCLGPARCATVRKHCRGGTKPLYIYMCQHLCMGVIKNMHAKRCIQCYLHARTTYIFRQEASQEKVCECMWHAKMH